MTRYLYFYSAKRSGGTYSSGELIAPKSASPGFFNECRQAIARLNGWSIDSFAIVSLSFLGEFQDETG